MIMLDLNHSEDFLIKKSIYLLRQIPHDETITYHSDVSVQDSLEALIQSLSLHPEYSLIIKSHPVNLSAMSDLKKIYSIYLSYLN